MGRLAFPRGNPVWQAVQSEYIHSRRFAELDIGCAAGVNCAGDRARTPVAAPKEEGPKGVV
jgi:hypothetical protein